MNFEIVKLPGLEAALRNLFSSEYQISNYDIDESIEKIRNFLSDLKDNISIGIEYPYIDRVYRNSYYYYYSSKFKKYHRDCIRLSFFDFDVTLDDFFSSDRVPHIQDNFLGILVIRPTVPNVIGRNILRPDIFKNSSTTYVATTSGYSAINGLKLSVKGFPHSSQDSEMNVCAETALWSILEYFSHRYTEYSPILPKQIQKIIATKSNKRQLPSPGLTILDMSYVLKQSGFGVQWYSDKDPDFMNLIKIYIESGIPVMAIVDNKKGTVHVMNLVGRTEFEGAVTYKAISLQNGGVLYDFYQQKAKYIVIDDNLSPYKRISLEDPASNYTGIQFSGCKIIGIIVPLSHKIYIEADKAKQFALGLLQMFDKLESIGENVYRLLLTSSRSYKHYVTQNEDFDKQVKIALVNLKMPKFIWVIELATLENSEQGKANGLMILDATEPKRPEFLAFLIKESYFGTINDKYGVYRITLPAFKIFHNLNQY